MKDASRTAARDLFTQAADAGVAPLMLNGSPWAVRREVLPQLADAALLPTVAGLTTRAAAPSGQPVTAGVAVIPLTGVITPQGSWFSFLFGGAPGGLAAFREAFAEAVNSPDVSAILIDVDSPGGLVDMVPETAAEIRAARGSKPIVAIADTQMASAAYWIASQADEIVITPSGYAGSIGVYRMHIDWSRANSEAGIAVTYVHAGQYKVEGNPDQPLDDGAREKWQSDVDDVYALFVADVAAGRGVDAQTVIDDYGQGRTMNAARALAAGLVDRIDTYEAVIGGLLGREPAGSSSAQSRAAQLASEISERQAALKIELAKASPADPADAPAAAARPQPEPEPDDADDDDLTDDERGQAAALLLA